MQPLATIARTSLREHLPYRSVTPSVLPCYLSLPPPPRPIPPHPSLDACIPRRKYLFPAPPRLLFRAICESLCGSAPSHQSFFLASRVRKSSGRPYTFFRNREVLGSQRPNHPAPAQSDSPYFQAFARPSA